MTSPLLRYVLNQQHLEIVYLKKYFKLSGTPTRASKSNDRKVCPYRVEIVGNIHEVLEVKNIEAADRTKRPLSKFQRAFYFSYIS
ncbi:hypothetical protein [Baaleninema simplex]|uniref:hypothetical protein n=1 Tax=Baaleninema simplex TaxID=2862350 RepID=UPI000349B6FA|nr:hypothetical protein [Baaleninema simplex]